MTTLGRKANKISVRTKSSSQKQHEAALVLPASLAAQMEELAEQQQTPRCCLEIPEQVQINAHQVLAKRERNSTHSIGQTLRVLILCWLPRWKDCVDPSGQNSKCVCGYNRCVCIKHKGPLRRDNLFCLYGIKESCREGLLPELGPWRVNRGQLVISPRREMQ